jgi:hypothetical protein
MPRGRRWINILPAPGARLHRSNAEAEMTYQAGDAASLESRYAARTVFSSSSSLPRSPGLLRSRLAIMRDRRAGATLDISSGAIAGISDTPAVPPSEFASCFALPGLVDMHVHLPPDNALKLTQGAALLYPCTA